LLALSGCATLAADKTKERLSEAQASAGDFKAVPFTEATGVATYTYAKRPQKVEWIDCKLAKPAGTIFVAHRDRAGFAAHKFCAGWIAQAFLSQGLDVVTVNRPGYGGSTGVVDFSGKQSMEAMEAGLKAALAAAKNPNGIDGIWGYATGASAAALFARHHQGFKYMILGGGVYDYEQTLKATTDTYLKTEIARIEKTGGVTAIEDRSVAYDVSGLPPRIAIYHGKRDTSAPLQQAKAFSDALESNGSYKVSYQEIDGEAHEMPWTHHRKILEVMARAFATGA
jgi:dipeptidyl aminopeptidase/acylaminoacyl peptidase